MDRVSHSEKVGNTTGRISVICQQPWRWALLAAVLHALLWTGACDKKVKEAEQHITYRLKWLFNTSVVGDLYADVHGSFAHEGLLVTIKEGGPERDAIKELELGHAQFGVASADQIIRAVSKGSPIVVLGQLFQTNPLQWIYRPDKTRINTSYDLRGKTIGITYGGNDETIMKALLAKYNIRTEEVKLFSVRYDYTPFYRGEVDLWPVYRNAEGIVIAEKLGKAGEQTRFFNPDEYGIHFVANSVITSQSLLKERPQTVEKFVKALLQGWQQALQPDNHEKALQTIGQFDRDTPMEIIGKQLQVTRVLMKPSSEIEIGRIDVDAWQETERIMVEQGLIPAPVSVNKILASHYAAGKHPPSKAFVK